ncbi:MAG TPA: hypothetical protein DEB56_14580 [Thiobacillus sp.]|nr:hypothetical protein [Thiobacillus sp.]
MPFIDPTTGQPIDLPEADAQQAFLAGKVGVSGDEVPVRDSMGNVGTVPASQLQDALQSGAYSLASDGALQQAQQAAKFGTTGQQALTLGETALSGLTFGLSDATLGHALGPQWGQESAGRRRENRATAITGEVGGMIGGALLTGGEGALAKGLSAPTRFISAAGRGVESMAARGLAGAGESGLARLAQATVPRILGGATEGALMGAGQAMSQSALGNPDARAEELIALGALTGGVLSGGLALGGYGLRAGANAMRRGVGGAADGTVNLAEALANRGKETALRLEQDAQRVLQENKGAIGEWAGDRAFKSTGGMMKEQTALMNLPAATRERAQQMMLEEVPALAGKQSLATVGVEEMAGHLGTLKSKAGQQIGGVLGQLDDVAKKTTGQMANVEAIVKHIDDVILPGLKNAPEKVQNVAREYAAELRKTYGTFDDAGNMIAPPRATLKDLHERRRYLDKEIYDKNSPLKKSTAKAEVYSQIRDAMEKQLEGDAERIAAKASPELRGIYQKAKVDFAAATTLAKAAERGVKGLQTNRTAGLSEHLTGMFGGFAGSLVGGPIGSVIGAGVGGAGAWAGKHYGDQALAAMAYKLSKGASVREVAAEMNRQVRDGVAGYLEKSNLGRQALDAGRRVLDSGRESGRKLLAEANDMRRIAGDTASRAATGTRRLAQRGAVLSLPEYTQTRAEIREQKGRPELLAASVQATGLQHAEPDVAKAMVSNARRINDFLDSKLPQQSLRPSLAGPKMLPPTGQDLAKFSRYLRAAKDPLSVLDDLRDDDLSPEAVEALKTCYPQLYGDITATVIDAVADAGESMPYDRRITLGLLLGVPTDPTLTPEYQQAMAAADAAPMPERGNPAPRPNPKPAPSRQTASERIASR